MKKSIAIGVLSTSIFLSSISATYAVWQGEWSSTCPEGMMCILGSSSASSALKTEEKTMFIWPHTVNKNSEDESQVLLVKQNPHAPWKKFNGTIDGFSFVSGHAYQLKVKRETLKDAKWVARFVYTLVKVERDITLTPSLKNTQWKLETINNDRLEIRSNMVFGETDFSITVCNSLSGTYKTSGDKLTVTGASTRMMCNSPTMPLETALQQTDTVYDVIGGKLHIRTSYGLEAVFVKVK